MVEADHDSHSVTAGSQLTFEGSHPNPVFRPNRFKKDMGEDAVKMVRYHRYAVKSDQHLLEAIEFSCDKEASDLSPAIMAISGGGLPPSPGKLLLGGFRCVFNLAYLGRHGVKTIVSTARDLGSFYVKYPAAVQTAKEKLGISFFECPWVDSETQQLVEVKGSESFQDGGSTFGDAIRCIHRTLNSCSSVLVHCAQGKSRSTTLCVGYLISLFHSTRQLDHQTEARTETYEVDLVDHVLSEIRRCRQMAQPNDNFMAQLRNLEAQGFFKGSVLLEDGTASTSVS
jgi:hypothetical protein